MTPLVLWMACLVVGIVSFHALGTGRLAPPPLAPAEWDSWAAGRDPLLATVAVLRLVVLALAWYLVGATSIGLIARLLRAARFVRLADAVTVPMVRRMLQGAVGLTMATAVVTASMPTVEADRSDEPGALNLSAQLEPDDLAVSARMTLVNQGAPEEPGSLRPRPDGGELTLRGAGTPPASDALTLRPSPSGERDAGTPDDDAASDGEGGVVEATDVDGPGDVAKDQEVLEHEVRAGESFWSIAEVMIAGNLDRQPTEDEVRDYWRTLVAANQDRLAVAGDADLIFPGQRFVLPFPGAVGDGDGHGS